ncbi:MAG: hypothetical protein Q7K44_03670 [Candidatus Liptonbacteria bacterium]|nr:hypothetical protein [Candidatus Liptonbacteria bacterium]
MNENRKGEIALRTLVYFAREKGIVSPPNVNSIKRFAAQISVPEDEMREFTSWLSQTLISNM